MNKSIIHTITSNAIELLVDLISIPSVSRHEDKSANCIADFLQRKGVAVSTLLNNVWAVNLHFDEAKPSILLNSHHDTVSANAAYTRNPHEATMEEGLLYGLGSTDAGASLVSLMATFLYYYQAKDLPYNLVFAASAEEEISGPNGVEALFAQEKFKALFTKKDSFAIVGEPTQLDLAIAEKGLLVLDCRADGKPGHAAREEGENALYMAMDAIDWFRNYKFEKISPLLGSIKMTVTSIHTHNQAHNIVPAQCNFVVDVRVTELYSHEELLDVIRTNVAVHVQPRSTRLRSSGISPSHPVVKAGLLLGKKTYGSPTTSDKALIPLTSLKCGPGFSGQSHSANEFVALKDIEDGIEFYIKLLDTTFKEYRYEQMVL
jgi:acetylornithine deacetylase